jgi:hypothetical protein
MVTANAGAIATLSAIDQQALAAGISKSHLKSQCRQTLGNTYRR